MIFQSSSEYEKFNTEPENGDMSWLWYKPGSGVNSSLHPSYNVHCAKCDVFEVHDPDSTNVHCWMCGRFVPDPKSWNLNHFNPYGGLADRRSVNVAVQTAMEEE